MAQLRMWNVNESDWLHVYYCGSPRCGTRVHRDTRCCRWGSRSLRGVYAVRQKSSVAYACLQSPNIVLEKMQWARNQTWDMRSRKAQTLSLKNRDIIDTQISTSENVGSEGSIISYIWLQSSTQNSSIHNWRKCMCLQSPSTHTADARHRIACFAAWNSEVVDVPQVARLQSIILGSYYIKNSWYIYIYIALNKKWPAETLHARSESEAENMKEAPLLSDTRSFIREHANAPQ